MTTAFPCDALVGACGGGHFRLAKAMLAMRATSLVLPMSEECNRGHAYLKNATIWDLAAHAACEGDHLAVVHFLLVADPPCLLLKKGATVARILALGAKSTVHEV